MMEYQIMGDLHRNNVSNFKIKGQLPAFLYVLIKTILQASIILSHQEHKTEPHLATRFLSEEEFNGTIFHKQVLEEAMEYIGLFIVKNLLYRKYKLLLILVFNSATIILMYNQDVISRKPPIAAHSC